MTTHRWVPGEELASGRKTIVWARSTDGTCPGKDFFDQLDDRDKAKFEALVEMMASQGKISNYQKFKKIDGDLFEFKATSQLRFPCFFDSRNRIVITHGFRKKSDDIPPREIERARGILGNYTP